MNVVLSLLLLLALTTPALTYGGSPLQEPAQTQSAAPLTNHDVLEMLKAGLSPEVVIAKIRSAATKFDTSPSGLQELKAANVPDAVMLAMLQPQAASGSDKASGSETKPKRLRDELTNSFKQLQSTVVTVWSDFGRGTGFIFDKDGLVMTNQHVIGPAEYIAVQFDERRKIPAVLLASNAEKDVAILWIDLSALPDATVAPLATANGDEPPVVEGERVLTIGSPLHQRKIMTTGIASKVEKRAIISDININHGNSGGPLFNSLGQVVGITTFKDPDQGGPGISGIVRIEEAGSVITEARSNMSQKAKPEARLLPVDPTDTFPLDAVKEIATAKKFDDNPYVFSISDFQIHLMTPTLKYRLATEAEREAAKGKEKRNKKEGAVQGTFKPFEEFRSWAEYVGEYQPVLTIRAMPKLGESFGSAFGRALAANYGIHARAKLHFKTDFYRMKLLCGDKVVEPIHPGKVAYVMSESNYFVSLKDATYEGLYTYPADAISPACGQVRLEIYSEKEPNKAEIKTLSAKTIERMAGDFDPYFKSRQKQ